MEARATESELRNLEEVLDDEDVDLNEYEKAERLLFEGGKDEKRLDFYGRFDIDLSTPQDLEMESP